jgi:photosystem II stability/assembly factor-like uncharacterized protein
MEIKSKMIITAMCCVFSLNYAQIPDFGPWVKELNLSKYDKIPFYEVVEKGNAYWSTRDKDIKGSGYKPFMRWVARWENYVDSDGYLPNSNDLLTAWNNKQSKNRRRSADPTTTDQSNWFSMGPTDFLNRPTSYLNLGRVNTVVPDPNNSNTVYVGTPAGGIWKSIDAGQSYIPLNDQLAQIGVSAIAIDPENSNTIYIATGDDDAYDSISIGVWKSTDAGNTWQPTGSMGANGGPSAMHEIYIDPQNSNTLWVASDNGIYKTTDAGVNWTRTLNGDFNDLKLKPGDSNTLYAVTSQTFYKSTNGGDSFYVVANGTPQNTARLVIDVTPANPEVVYIVAANNQYSFEGIYKSINSGESFLRKNNTFNIFESTQAWYDLAVAVSDTDENEIYVGVLNIWKSVNGGDSFSQINEWYTHNASYTHADIHYLRFFNNELLVGSDGGYYKSTNGGVTFTDLTGGMAIGQFYRLSVSQQSSNKIAGGLQDNGGFSYFNQWNNYHGGDGMESVIDPNNDNLYYGFMQTGTTLFVSNSSGMEGTTSYNSPTSGNWITPLSINSDSEVYAGYSSLYNFDNGNWFEVSSNFGTNIDVLELDPTDSDIMYVATNNILHRSTDHGQTFNAITTFNSDISSIEVNNNFNNVIYVTTRGSNGKVFRSENQGDSFIDITGSLPNLTKNIIKHQPNTTTNVLYLGTSLGVYRFDDLTSSWLPFEVNLPNTSVSDLAINTIDNNISASTYGRGVWRSQMPQTPLAAYDVRLDTIMLEALESNVSCGNPTIQIQITNNGLNTVNSIDINYNIDGGSNETFVWNGVLEPQESQTININNSSLLKGEHTIEASVTTSNDYFSVNNSDDFSFLINDTGIGGQINTFESNDDILFTEDQNGTNVWTMGTPSPFTLNETSSGTQLYATNLMGDYDNNQKGYFVSQCYDMNFISNPVLKFHMAYSIEFDWDLLYVEYSTNLGESWNLLGTSEDPNWYNSSRFSGDGIANNCYNCVGGQWTGDNLDMQEYSYDLSNFSTQPNMLFRVVFHSDEYVTLPGAIIDDFYVDGTALSNEDYDTKKIAVFPNPSSSIFNIQVQNSIPYKISVSDLSGKIVFQDDFNGQLDYVLDMSYYSKGMYFLKIESDQQQSLEKLILK